MNFIKRANFLGLSSSSALILVALSLLSTITEIFGVGIFLPIFQFINADGDVNLLVADSQLWKYLVKVYEYIGKEINLILLLITTITLFLMRQIFIYIRLIYLAHIRQKMQKNVSIQIMDDYLAADSDYHDKITTGDLINAIIKELNLAIISVITPFGLITILITMIGYFFVLMVISVQMTIAGLVVVLLAGVISMTWVRQSYGVGKDLVKANSHISSFLHQRIKNPRLIYLSGTEEAEIKAFTTLAEKQRIKSIVAAKLKVLTAVVVEPIIIAGSLIFIFIAYGILHMNIELIGLYLIIILRLMPSAKEILHELQSIKSYRGSFDKIYDYIEDIKYNKKVDAGNLTVDALSGDIEFDNVSYCYNDATTNALSNISFKVPNNSIVAIVGPSGSGKSTLIDLLVRIRQPSSGEISIDNSNINSIKLKELKSMISYVPQLPQIFGGNILDHIMYGNNNASDNEVEYASRLAGASDFIDKLKYHYKTPLDEDATNLSGGQRQRLDLARVLLKHGRILIFDEPTSNLDASSSNKIMESFFRINSETHATIIIVTHDITLASKVPIIMVLDDGKLSSIGSHDHQLESSNWYLSTYNKAINNALDF